MCVSLLMPRPTERDNPCCHKPQASGTTWQIKTAASEVYFEDTVRGVRLCGGVNCVVVTVDRANPLLHILARDFCPRAKTPAVQHKHRTWLINGHMN